MINIVRYDSSLKEKWDEFNKISKNCLFMFFRDYMDYHKDRYLDHSLLFFNDNKLVAIFPGNEKEKILYSHGGLTYGGFIICTSMTQSIMNDCMSELRRYCLHFGFEKVIYKAIPYIYHRYPAFEDRYSLFINNGNLKKIEPSTVVDLKEPSLMSKLRKRQINRAMKMGVEVLVQETRQGYKEYVDLLNDVLLKYHNVKAVHTFEELFYLYTKFPENIKLYAATWNGIITAGCVVFIYDNVVHTQYLASSDEGRKIGALDLAVRRIVDDFCDKVKYLDFGISSEKNGMFLNEGLIHQKEGFGGRTVTYETWEIDM